MTGSGEMEKPVTNVTELSEALGLGSSLATMNVTLKYVAESATRTERISADTLALVNTMQVGQAQQGEQIKTLFTQDETMRAELSDVPKTYATKDEVATVRTEQASLRAELASRGLTWPKLLAGIGAVVAALAALDWLPPKP